MKTNSIKLVLGGVEWEGWESVTSTRRLNAVAGEFTLAIADKWHDGLVPVAAGLAAALSCDGEAVHTGYLHAVTGTYATDSSSINISGRDKSWDLAECSLMGGSLQYTGQNLARLAGEWCLPFGIKVDAPEGVGPAFDTFKVDPGETVWAAFDRAARQREFFVMPDRLGGVRLVKLGALRSATILAEGDNIKSYSSATNNSGRYSEYIVQAQRQAADNLSADAAASVVASVRDSGAGRYRPLVIRAENQMNEETAKLRAEWEKKTRAAASYSLGITVQGWRDRQGLLWEPNMLVMVNIPSRALFKEFLITAVSASKTIAGGTQCQLELKDPVALSINPNIKQSAAFYNGQQAVDGSLVFGVGQKDQAEIERIIAETEGKKTAAISEYDAIMEKSK